MFFMEVLLCVCVCACFHVYASQSHAGAARGNVPLLLHVCLQMSPPLPADLLPVLMARFRAYMTDPSMSQSPSPFPALIANIYHSRGGQPVFPTPFDSLSLREAKLDGIARHGGATKEPEREEWEERFVRSLVCFDDAATPSAAGTYAASSAPVQALMRTLRRALSPFPPRPSSPLFAFIKRLLQLDSPTAAFPPSPPVPLPQVSFLPQIISMMAAVKGDVQDQLSACLYSLLLTLAPSWRLLQYLPLLSYVLTQPTISPLPLLSLLPSLLSPILSHLKWRDGNELLTICTTIMTHHLPLPIPPNSTQHPLASLLLLLHQSFPDLEIRDRSGVIFRLLTYLPTLSLSLSLVSVPLVHIRSGTCRQRNSCGS